MDTEKQPVRETPDEPKNPWQDPAALSGVHGGNIAFFAILWILSAMLLPLADRTEFVLPVGIVLLVGVFFLTKKKISGVILTLIAAAALWQATFYGAYLGVVLLAAVVGTLSGAYLITRRKLFWLVPAGAAVAGGLTYLYSGNLTRALFCAVLIPAAVLLGTATLRGEWRRSAIRFAMVGILAGIVAALCWYVVDRFGSLSGESLTALSNGWKAQTEQTILSWREDLLRTARVAYALDSSAQTSFADVEAAVRSQWSDVAIANLAGTLQIVLPAAVLVFCQAVAYLAQKLLCGAFLTVGPREAVQLENEYLTASVPAAILYAAAFVISFFGDAGDSLFFAASENVYLFLLPALLFAGLRVYLGYLVHATPGGRTVLLLLFFAVLCCSFSSALAILGFFGAWNAIAGALARAARNRMQDE